MFLIYFERYLKSLDKGTGHEEFDMPTICYNSMEVCKLGVAIDKEYIGDLGMIALASFKTCKKIEIQKEKKEVTNIRRIWYMKYNKL